jgi:hypothetical protein
MQGGPQDQDPDAGRQGQKHQDRQQHDYVQKRVADSCGIRLCGSV